MEEFLVLKKEYGKNVSKKNRSRFCELTLKGGGRVEIRVQTTNKLPRKDSKNPFCHVKYSRRTDFDWYFRPAENHGNRSRGRALHD